MGFPRPLVAHPAAVPRPDQFGTVARGALVLWLFRSARPAGGTNVDLRGIWDLRTADSRTVVSVGG